MDVELTLPSSPVALAPGVATRVPVELRNPEALPLDVRISVARGRASGWASVDPPTATIGGYATATVDVVLQTPPDQPPSGSLLPFTVHAENAASGEPAGFATGLLTVAVPVPVRGDLSERPGDPHAFDLRLSNHGDQPADVRITAKLDPPAGSAEARPQAARLEAGASLSAVVRARPSRPFLGTAKQYAVIVSVRDGGDLDRRPLLTAVGHGTRKPRLPKWVAGTAAILLALGATAAVAFSGIRLPMPGFNRATPPPPSALAPAPAPATPVSRPFALVDVFPQRAAADAQRVKLEAGGMPIRMVDSLTSDDLADGGAGFWVLLQDGFASADEAQAYCEQWRAVAPKCRVTP
jgi:hypothetical protein